MLNICTSSSALDCFDATHSRPPTRCAAPENSGSSTPPYVGGSKFDAGPTTSGLVRAVWSHEYLDWTLPLTSEASPSRREVLTIGTEEGAWSSPPRGSTETSDQG
jgi:hypothetical protein